MAKNFQTTQGPVAFCMRGHLDLDVDGAAAKERIDIADLKPGESGAEGTTAANVTRTEDAMWLMWVLSVFTWKKMLAK